MKKLMAILCGILCLLPCLCSAAADWQIGDWEYKFDSNTHTAKVMNYCGEGGDATIPEKIDVNGYTVTEVRSGAFYNNKLTSVKIPNTISKLSGQDFYKSVKVVINPDNPYFALIDGVLFEKETKMLIHYPSNEKVTSYSVPQGIKEISEEAFDGCSELTEIILPDSVEKIGTNAFWGCDGLKSITIPGNVTSFVQSFRTCSNLEEVILSDGVTSIGPYAFEYCPNLTKVSIPETVTSIGFAAFNECTSLQEITLPDSLTKLSGKAFNMCPMPSIILPKNLSEFTGNPFEGFTGTIEISSDNPYITFIDSSLFVMEPQKLVACMYPEDTTEYEVPDGTKIIGKGAFVNCEGLTHITLPESIEEIEKGAITENINGVEFVVVEGSYAHNYIQENGLNYAFPGGSSLDWLNS